VALYISANDTFDVAEYWCIGWVGGQSAGVAVLAGWIMDCYGGLLAHDGAEPCSGAG
jgi:hypothetical protein